MTAGAAPTHKGENRTATPGRIRLSDRHLLLQARAAITAACAIDLDHAFEASSETLRVQRRWCRPVIFSTSPGRAPTRFRSLGRGGAIACPMSSTRASATRSVSVVATDDEVSSVMAGLQLALHLVCESVEKRHQSFLLRVIRLGRREGHAGRIVPISVNLTVPRLCARWPSHRLWRR